MASLRQQLNITLIRKAHGGPAAARNEGAGRARGKFLAFTDDDCAPERDWLRKLAERFGESPEHAMGGRTVNGIPGNAYSITSQVLVDYVLEYYNRIPDQARLLTSNNLAVPAGQFRLVGGFDKTFLHAAAEDRDFCDRWLAHGYSATYAPEVLVYHRHALTLAKFVRQHFNYGRGAFHFHRSRALRGTGRLRIEPPRFYLDLFRASLKESRQPQRISLALLMVVSQGANAAGFVWESLKAGICPERGAGASGHQEAPK